MKKIPEYYCVKCLRPTTEKSKQTNRFVICHNCKNIWCNECMAKIYGVSLVKMRKIGEANEAYCPICYSKMIQVKFPQPHDIGFTQPIHPDYENKLSITINPNVPIFHPKIEARKKRLLNL